MIVRGEEREEREGRGRGGEERRGRGGEGEGGEGSCWSDPPPSHCRPSQ